jgi:hypothetical protein
VVILNAGLGMLWFIRFTMCSLYPRTARLPGVGDTGVDQFLARFRRETTLAMWLGICLGALLFVLSPIGTVGWPVPAFWLPRAKLDRHARKLAASRFYLVRQLIVLVKMMAGFCWGADPKVRRAFNLPALPPDPGSLRTV